MTLPGTRLSLADRLALDAPARRPRPTPCGAHRGRMAHDLPDGRMLLDMLGLLPTMGRR